MKQTSLVVDGNYLLFQSFYATFRGDLDAIMRNSKGVATNALSIFLSQLNKLIIEIQPDYLFIAFDARGKTKRHLIYEEYKSGRTKAPQELFDQFELIKQLLTDLAINWQEQEGYEADDLIASYCSNIPGEKVIFSRDKDLLQLINDEIVIIDKLNPATNYIKSDNFFDLFNFYPNQVIDYKALKGDPSDNLPGIKGIGEKTAIKLLEQFGTFDNIYQNINSPLITKSIKNKLLTGQAQGQLCYELATLNPNVPDFDTNIEHYAFKINYQNALALLNELELNRAKKQIANWTKL
ncbi:DNA polymerase I [Mycoplasma sp. NEAQ87857]|uniref:5'-3' exonuclease n=1 Tax=Mycoplasma sp. NEAQ87857 TaxID=2683967 RepID=UPI0013163208|nr:5'-3' exonuclease [Mycoplasma sp. NEAQ87857]QGZ97203.1 DNA polymerase I [Mycoplasma sp. NEAQ87857]